MGSTADPATEQADDNYSPRSEDVSRWRRLGREEGRTTRSESKLCSTTPAEPPNDNPALSAESAPNLVCRKGTIEALPKTRRTTANPANAASAHTSISSATSIANISKSLNPSIESTVANIQREGNTEAFPEIRRKARNTTNAHTCRATAFEDQREGTGRVFFGTEL